MNPGAITSSPQANLADLFLDTISSSASSLMLNTGTKQADRAFQDLLNNSLKNTASSRPADRPSDFRIGREEEPCRRRDPIDELQSRVDDLGLPLESISLGSDGVESVRTLLKESGFSDSQIREVASRLSSSDPVTMDKVLAAVKSVKKSSDSPLKISEDTLPLLGRFLQDMGFGADQVKDILGGLQPGESFGADTLRDILLKNGGKNLKGPVMMRADTGNLKDMLASLGMDEKSIAGFLDKMKQSEGRISLEGFLGFLKSADSPEPLSKAQMDSIGDILKNAKMEESLHRQPKFNRITSLLYAMEDKDINPKFMSTNPAVQALRGGTNSGAALDGFGQNAGGKDAQNGGSFNSFQTEISAADMKAEAKGASFRLNQVTLPSRLSEAVARQVAEKMVYNASNGRHTMKIQLNPADLGKLDINLVMKNSHLHANIIADNQAVKAALEEQMAQLKETLAQQGLNLDSFDVSCRGERESAGFGDGGRQGSGRGAPSADSAGMPEDPSPAQANSYLNTGYVDRLI